MKKDCLPLNKLDSLKTKDLKNVGTWSNNQASKMISRISASGWRIPKGVVPATYKPPVEEFVPQW